MLKTLALPIPEPAERVRRQKKLFPTGADGKPLTKAERKDRKKSRKLDKKTTNVAQRKENRARRKEQKEKTIASQARAKVEVA
jgi:hypothetical protein